MIGRLHKRYVLEDYGLEPDRQLLSRGGQPVHLPKKPFQVLLYLIEQRDRFVSRAELFDLFWDGKEVYDDALRKCIGAIRKALDDQSDQPRFVETRWGVGYRYIGPVDEQLVHGATTVTEIKKTRGVKIVVEEEEIQNGTTTPEKPTVNLSPAPALSLPAPKRRTKITALTLVFLTVAIGTVVLFRYGRQPSTTEIPSALIRSVAVMPLKNFSAEPENDYFSDGLTESIITSLSQIEGPKIASRNSAFVFKGKDLDPRELGKKLGVDAVLEGSVRQSGDNLRVEVRLVSTRDGQVLWASDTYDRKLRDIFIVQDEIARNIATELRMKLSATGEQRLTKRYTDNLEAYQAYLKARFFLNQRTPEGITKGIEYFHRALANDPNYALAYAGLAEGYDKAYWFMELHPKQMMAKEKEAALKALALDDSLAEAHVAMATVYANEWDLLNAAREEQRAIEINPGNAEAHHNYAYRLIDLCKPNDAIAEIQHARELDAFNIVMNIDVGEILFLARHYDEAIDALRNALEMDPDRANAHWNLAQAYQAKGMYAEAVAEHLKEFTLKGESSEMMAALNAAYGSSGIKGFWRKRLEQELKRSYVEPVKIAVIYTDLGDKDQAFAWLEKAYRQHSPELVGLKSSAKVDSLRSDPRYADLVRRVGLA